MSRIAILISISVAVFGAAQAAGPTAITSAYTHLNLDHCTGLRADPDAPDFTRWRCRGFAGIPLFVQSADDRYDVDAGQEDNDALYAPTFDYPGPTVEWRLSRGKPFAIIYRLNSAIPELPKTSRLIVESIGRPGTPGCAVAAIDGTTPNANAKAREAADGLRAHQTHCLKN